MMPIMKSVHLISGQEGDGVGGGEGAELVVGSVLAPRVFLQLHRFHSLLKSQHSK